LSRPCPPHRSRLLRGGAVSAVTVLLTVTGHTVAGGPAPNAGLLVLLCLPLAAIMISLGDRQPGIGGLLLTLGSAQLGLHVLFSMLGGHTHVGVAAQDATPQMITVHLVLTLVTGWLLRCADDGLATLGALLQRVLRLVLHRPVRPLPALAAAPITATPTVTWLLDVLFSRIRLRRGPPVPA
jgi:hypothetical protein